MFPEIHLNLIVLKETFAVCRLAPGAEIPPQALQGSFISVTRTSTETSIICLQGQAPSGAEVEGDWRCIEVEGPLAFTQIGLLASLLLPLAEAEISIMAVSTFDTDYILVKERNLEMAVHTLTQAGHFISRRGY
jgi:uncharacterized protein